MCQCVCVHTREEEKERVCTRAHVCVCSGCASVYLGVNVDVCTWVYVWARCK